MKSKILEVVSIDLQILKSAHPVLVIKASGLTSSSGWTNAELNPFHYPAPPADGYFDFDFVAEHPSGQTGNVLSAIEVKFVWLNFPKELRGVRIHASKNKLQKELGNTVLDIVPGGGSEAPRGIFYRHESIVSVAVNAILNLKEKPAKLYVHGSGITFKETDQLKITKVTPQGTNPAILMLNLELKEGQGPVKPTPKHFTFEDISNQVTTYEQVQVNYGLEGSYTTVVEVLG